MVGTTLSLYEKSAGIIYENLSLNDKKIKAFANSAHLITFGKDKESLFEEVISFIHKGAREDLKFKKLDYEGDNKTTPFMKKGVVSTINSYK